MLSAKFGLNWPIGSGERLFNFPLEKIGGLHINKIESSSPMDAFVPNLVEIGPVVLEKKMKM